MNPSFEVSAKYFYALGAHLPPEVSREQRYRTALGMGERQAVEEMRRAVDTEVIVLDPGDPTDPVNHPPDITPEQAGRRLRALGAALGTSQSGRPVCLVGGSGPLFDLVDAWLAFKNPNPAADYDPAADIAPFWLGLSGTEIEGHLDLVLCAITGESPDPLTGEPALWQAIKSAGGTSVVVLASWSAAQWRALFYGPNETPLTNLLPDFTLPGTHDERVAAFIRHVRRFFEAAGLDDVVQPLGPQAVPEFGVPGSDVLLRLAAAYLSRAGSPLVFGQTFDESLLRSAVDDVLPDEPVAQDWLEQLVLSVEDLFSVTEVGLPELQTSLMEALYARGFVRKSDIQGLTLDAFEAALTGTVAHAHAGSIYANADANPVPPTPVIPGFQAVNQDGTLTLCTPSAHRSPLGPVAYLSQMLQVSNASTCRNPLSPLATDPLRGRVEARRGAVGSLDVTRANTETRIPRIDIVNECLEALAVRAPGVTSGEVYATASDDVAGHLLVGGQTGGADDTRHEAATLLAAVPEHSSPATPTAMQAAYGTLRDDFSAPELPYDQPVDVARTYLGHVTSASRSGTAATARFGAMRTFRRDITELALEPGQEPAEFQRHLWRYPVRIDIAREYLGLTAQEHARLFSQNQSEPELQELFGFAPLPGGAWLTAVAQVSEFIRRTGLQYCEFLALWESEFVTFQRAGGNPDFEDCEACHLELQTIEFVNPADPQQALARLAVFIRLWRKLQAVPGADYSFAELADLCNVLGLFGPGGVNGDFVRQLSAFQMLRDELGLPLQDETDEPAAGATGADRTHLLALWVGPTANKWSWAVGQLLDRIQDRAQAMYECPRRPELVKLLAENLDPLSRLVGFEPAQAADTWHARPTHTLRFAEVLAKIYASRFGVGEILFLFTADAHVTGDDPFPLQPDNEALESPLDLPDDEDAHSLWQLRRKLLDIEVTDEDAAAWTWTRIDAAMREELGWEPPGGAGSPDPLIQLGERLFPGALEASGWMVDPLARQYRVALAGTSAPMWNTPPDGPFRYDASAQELWTEVPVRDADVLAKLARVRQLSATEQQAVRDLYFLPRRDLAQFSFVFDDFAEAEQRLLQEPDEAARWAYFQKAFARCYARCEAIAEHLTEHVEAVTGQSPSSSDTSDTSDGGAYRLAWRLLVHLFGDENLGKTSWDTDVGAVPEVTWGPRPHGGAFAALLGLTGTGLVGEIAAGDDDGAALIWRELRGPAEVFGAAGDARNGWNAPVPTVVPAMNFAPTPEQERFVGVRNGFALANVDGAPLGGAQGFRATWRGMLLVEEAGVHVFRAGVPMMAGTDGDSDGDGDGDGDGEAGMYVDTDSELAAELAKHHRWRVTLRRGQKTWVLLSHEWPGASAPAMCSAPLSLKRGAFSLTIELARDEMVLDGPEDTCRRTTGFALAYEGPDTGGATMPLPLDRLFADRKDATLDDQLDPSLSGAAREFLTTRYTSTLRDVRRTYMRAFRALLFAHRLELSAAQVSDSGQSEIGYLLAHPVEFTGRAYYRRLGSISVHRAQFDPNFLPVDDNYLPPEPAQDFRATPTFKRKPALFDWWERLFDYTSLRTATRQVMEQPAWLLFHEADENHPDDPAHLLRHLGVDLRHAQLVLRYFAGQAQVAYQVTSADLEDERWAVRVWRADGWLEAAGERFAWREIREARPDLWAATDPGAAVTGAPETGNENLTRFVRVGEFENGEPRRYEAVKRLNDGLRERARVALIAYLCRMDRVPLPGGGFAREARALSDLLLIDVDAGLWQQTSRIEDAISAVQVFVQRHRLGLEPAWSSPAELVLLWDRRFATFRTWEACRRRELYRENWIDWDELEAARRTEAFRLLESELSRASLSLPEPGGQVHWSGPRPVPRGGLELLQSRTPAGMALLAPQPGGREGFDLLGTPERHGWSSWLSAIPDATPPRGTLPAWIEAAVRLGAKFVRVAAAGPPPAVAMEPTDVRPEGCCTVCGQAHDPVVDEYYFWIVETEHYRAINPIDADAAPAIVIAENFQDADVRAGTPNGPPGWHTPSTIPTLLEWESIPMVHLNWCRVHNGEFQPPRRSAEGVMILPDGAPELRFMGRQGDSLRFEVDDGQAPEGHFPTPPPGFRYDMVDDAAVVLPLVTPPPAPVGSVGGLLAYPYFAYFAPGDSLSPSPFGPALSVAGALRARCRFEDALAWYERVFDPMSEDARWCPGGNPCNSVVPDEVARRRSITLHHLETLLDWGDAVMRSGSPEALQRARLLLDTASRVLGSRPGSVREADSGVVQQVAGFSAGPAPLNPRLVSLYDRVADRLGVIRARQDAQRLRTAQVADVVFGGDSALRDGWQTTDDVCLDEGDWCVLPCPYRFMFLLQKAQELAGEVRGLGGALLSAYEKGDAEYLAALRQSHERQMLELALSIRKDQYRESDWQVQALRKTKEIAQTRRRYYQFLIDRGLVTGEIAYLTLTALAVAFRTAGNIQEAVARVTALIPDMYVGTGTMERLPVGTKLAESISTISRILNVLADIANTGASVALTEAGWQRREDEWRHQVEVLDIEIEQIERQILASERRRAIALRELNNHQRQIENSAEVQEFLRDKFTSHQLYLYLQKETAALHYQMYELALLAARQAEGAFNLERGHTARRFVPAESWDNLREGLLAGERLQLALRRMERTYLDENVREYELTKHLSLRMHFPLQFLQLELTGWCELEIPEWMFDLDYPGHYMRRIKNVTMTIPCVVGPYTGVHCRLTLLGSATRVDPRLAVSGGTCRTEDGQCDGPGADDAAGYEAMPDDPRIVKQYAATEAIATSSGQSDGGLFQLDFRDERYLPFEYAGAVSRWRIELPPENNYFDMDTLSDVVLHMGYMAREGGEALRRAAHESAQRHTPDAGWRLFDIRHEFPNAWQRFQADLSGASATGADDAETGVSLTLRVSRKLFAFLPGNRAVTIKRAAILFEAAGAEPSAHHIVELLAGYDPAQSSVAPDDCDVISVQCVAGAEWPGVYHGVVDTEVGPLGQPAPGSAASDHVLGTFRFPTTVNSVSRAFLVCAYEATP